MKKIALYSVKGGVGKSTVAVNLAVLSALSGKKVLLLDLDTQGAASFYLNIEAADKGKIKALVNGKDSVNELIRASDIKNLDVLPARKGLRNLDLELDDSSDGLKPLIRLLKTQYDLLVIDSPPQIGLTGEAIIEVADFVLVPVVPSPLSLRTLDFLNEFFKKDSRNLAKIIPFFSMVDARKKLHLDLMGQTKQLYANSLEAFVPQSVEFEKMGIKKTPLVLSARGSRAGQALQSLFEELQGRGVL